MGRFESRPSIVLVPVSILVFLSACGGSGTSESSLVQACAAHQTYQASQGTDVYNSTFLEGRDPELASEDVIATCCPVYAEESMKHPEPELRELAAIRLLVGSEITQDERNKLRKRWQEIEKKFDKETLDAFWRKGAMQEFNACRKENFFPKMP